MRLVYEHLTDIPANFTEVEYLQSSGTQYIDTGYIASNTSGFKVDIMPLQASDRYFIGSRPRLNSDDRFLAGSNAGPQVYVGWNTNTFVNWTLNNVHTIQNNFMNSRTKVLDGTTIAQITSNLSSQNTRTVYLFSANDATAVSMDTCRIYKVQISEGSVLVRDFVPCLDNNNVPCMYDKVEGKAYYNAGTGSFTYGRKIIPVEYLESTGTQWINTGIFPTNEMEFESKFTFTSLVSTNLTVIGSRDSTKRCQPIGAYNNKWSASIGGSYDANGSSVSANTSYVVKSIISNGQTITLTVNGNQASVCTSTTGLPNKELYIFGRNFYGNTDPVDSRINAKMYFMKIKSSNVLVRDFVPCKDENNVGFMFDRVTHTAYLNAGTGSFTFGKVMPKKKLRLIRESKRRLPKGFKEVEYLQSSGTQYIDLGITSKSSMKAKSKFNLAKVSAQAIFGSANAISNGVGVFFGTASTGAVYCNNTSNTISPPLTLVANTDYEFDMSLTAVSINGVNYTASTTSDNNYNMLLFARILAGSVDRNISGKIYYFKLYDNGVLVRDFIPCLDASNVPCMYDLVEGKAYYNAGTGSFTYGHTITPIEYLESSGTQYINTGITTAEGICTEAKFKINQITSTSQVVFGKVGSTTPPMSRYWFGAQGSSLKWYYAVNEYVATSVNADSDIHTVVLDTVNNVCTLDGETIATFSDLNSNSETISLFSVFYQGSLNNPMSGRIYYTKILNNGTLVRDYIPVKDENNVGYMFDKVTHSLYANAGTGSFVIGNEIKQDITRFVKDDIPNIYQKVSYLQSSGTQYIDTGYKPTVDTETEVFFDNYQFNRIEYFFGCYSTDYRTNCYHAGCYQNDIRVFVNGSPALSSYVGNYVASGGTTGVSFPTNLQSIKMTKSNVVINGTTYTYTQNPNTPINVTHNMLLFGASDSGSFRSDRGFNGKIKCCRIKNSNVPVRDFVPVVRKYDNKPGMYDRVTKQFFTNAGTGEFNFG